MKAAATVLLAVLAGGCVRPSPPRTIVVITLDTTRADHLGCYGDAKAHTPAIDALAAESALFEQAQATVPVTLPSHASMFTGELPLHHGVRYNGMFKVAASSVLLAERLREAGWRTAAVPASFPVTRASGLDQGFEVYRDLFTEAKGSLPRQAERKADDVTKLGLEWLGERKEDERVFLWLHYFDPHEPYAPPFPWSAQFRDHPYDGEIAFMDAQLQILLDGLRKSGRWEEAAIVVAGDHGEGLYDHGEPTHGELAYQSTLHVPLLVRAPGVRAARVAEPVSLVDVAPTVLELAGLPVPAMDGRSLVPALRGKPLESRPLYFESHVGSLLYGWSPLEGVRRGRHKLIRAGGQELYDVEAEPAEKTDRSGTDAEVTGDLAADLDRILAQGQGVAPAEAASAPMDTATMQRLASLGYLSMGGGVKVSRSGGLSPRQGVHLVPQILRGRDLADAGQHRAALDVWSAVLQDDPRNRFALYQTMLAYVGLKDGTRGIEAGEKLLAVYPEFSPGRVTLGELYVRSHDLAKAVDTFAAGVAQDPKDVALGHRLVLALMTARRFPEARVQADRLIALDPKVPAFVLARAVCRAHAGDRAGAQADLDEAIRLGYRDRQVLTTEPLLAPLRALPGFTAALDRIQAPAAPARPAS